MYVSVSCTFLHRTRKKNEINTRRIQRQQYLHLCYYCLIDTIIALYIAELCSQI